jgi:hypothetical protein
METFCLIGNCYSAFDPLTTKRLSFYTLQKIGKKDLQQALSRASAELQANDPYPPNSKLYR